MKTSTAIIVGMGVLGAGVGVFLLLKKSSNSALPIYAGAPNGALSSAPGIQYPWSQPQAARADNNPALNNQPWAGGAPSGGGFLSNLSAGIQNLGGIASATSDIWDTFSNLFGSSGEIAASDAFSLSDNENFDFDSYDAEWSYA